MAVAFILFDSEYQLKIVITLPEKLFVEMLLGEIQGNGNFESNKDYESNEDYDWKMGYFYALKD